MRRLGLSSEATLSDLLGEFLNMAFYRFCHFLKSEYHQPDKLGRDDK
jgi:hypothetical protein